MKSLVIVFLCLSLVFAVTVHAQETGQDAVSLDSVVDSNIFTEQDVQAVTTVTDVNKTNATTNNAGQKFLEYGRASVGTVLYVSSDGTKAGVGSILWGGVVIQNTRTGAKRVAARGALKINGNSYNIQPLEATLADDSSLPSVVFVIKKGDSSVGSLSLKLLKTYDALNGGKISTWEGAIVFNDGSLKGSIDATTIARTIKVASERPASNNQERQREDDNQNTETTDARSGAQQANDIYARQTAAQRKWWQFWRR